MSKRIRYMVLAAIALCLGALHLHRSALAQTSGTLLHRETSFDFVVAQPYDRVAPLFGANGERAWGGADWDPQFAYPQPVEDGSGAVFTTEHSGHKMYWVTPVFDLKKRHIQHVTFMPDAFVAVVDITFPDTPSNSTKVHVAYQRTALSPAFNEHVETMSAHGAHDSTEWQKAIEEYFASQQKH